MHVSYLVLSLIGKAGQVAAFSNTDASRKREGSSGEIVCELGRAEDGPHI